MWNADLFLKQFNRLVDTNDCGHLWAHKHMTKEQLKQRKKDEKKKSVSTFLDSISDDEIKESMKLAAVDWAEDIANWLNKPYAVYTTADRKAGKKNPNKEYIEIDLEHPIGLILTKKDWSEKSFFAKGSCLIIALSKKDVWSGTDFEITTAYCDLTLQEELDIRKKMGL